MMSESTELKNSKEVTLLKEEQNIEESNEENTSERSEDENSEENSSGEEESEEDDFIPLSRNNSDLFVVTLDTLPKFYTKDISTARKIMWSYARHLKFNYIIDWNCYIREENSSDEIQIVGFYKFFVASYERVFHRFQIHKIKELITSEDITPKQPVEAPVETSDSPNTPPEETTELEMSFSKFLFF